MKKTLAVILLALVMMLTMTACDNNDTPDPPSTTPAETTPIATTPTETTPTETTPTETTPAETTAVTVVSALESAKATELYTSLCGSNNDKTFAQHNEAKVVMTSNNQVLSETTTTNDAIVSGQNYSLEMEGIKMTMLDGTLYMDVMGEKIKTTLTVEQAANVLGQMGVNAPTSPSEVGKISGEKLSDGTTQLHVEFGESMLDVVRLTFETQFAASGVKANVTKLDCGIEITLDSEDKMTVMVTTMTGDIDVEGTVMTMSSVTTSTMDYTTTKTVTAPADADSYTLVKYEDMFG